MVSRTCFICSPPAPRMVATPLLLPLTSGSISTSRKCSCKIAFRPPSRNCPRLFSNKGVVTKKKSTAILQIITLTSPDAKYDALFLSNFATLQLRDKLARVQGVSDVNVFGIGQYSMRVWLDPRQMLQRSLMPSDVIAAIQKQNAFVSAGQINMPPAPAGEDFQLTIDVKGDLSTVGEFENIIVKYSPDQGGQITRLRDIGRIELGAQTYSQFFKMDGKVAGGIAIYQLPEANALDTAKRVRATMAELAQGFPKGLLYTIPFDTTLFVKASVNEVYHTLFEAGALVLIVIVVFLQDWRATLVPATTVPVTIIGAFAAMSVMGFTINLLTLFAIVLAIGIVVDDAIVVVEGASQHLERGKTAEAGEHRRDERTVWTHPRGHSGLDVGIRAAGLYARYYRTDVSPVRARHRRDCFN